MSCLIAQNPQILPSPQPIQKPQNSSYSKYALGFAAGTVATGALIGNALAINSLMKETPSLFSNVINAQNLTSVLNLVGTSVVGGLGGALISGTIGKCVALSVCPIEGNSDVITFFSFVTPIFSAFAGGIFGAVALPAVRLLPF